jgi:ABC-type glycerol-3-phosphate transport system substrate-binding protein
MTRRLAALISIVTTGGLLAACGAGDEPVQSGRAEGEITVLTQRTDIVDSVFIKQYLPKFNAKYPDVKVKFEAITDYEGEVRIRMNTKDYGDVLLIPNSVTADQLPTFFEPLGSVDDLAKKYRYVTEQAYQGKTYGLAITGNAQGIVYNKKVFAAAGVTEAPKSPDEFLAALRAVKNKTDAIPLYTNYSAGWPLTQWEGNRGSVSGDPDNLNKLVEDDAPWAEGKDHYVIGKLLYDVVREGLTEPDPTTTDWEKSKPMIGSGKIGAMVLGSWAIIQTQEKAANKADIGYWPFPTQVDGKFVSITGGDYKNAINVNSEHKAAARAWVDWFADESNYAFEQGGISPRLDGKPPTQLAEFEAMGVNYLELKPAPSGQEGMVQRIDAAAEIGLSDPKFPQRIVDAGRGSKKESLDDIFGDLNSRWAKARAATK